VSFAAAQTVSHFLTTPTATALNREHALLLAASRHSTAVQQAVGKPLNATYDCDHLLIGFQCVEMFVKNVFDHSAELKHIVGSRGIDDRDCRREVLMLPVAVGGDGGSELGSGELAEAVRLVFYCHSENFGMLYEEAFPRGRRRIKDGPRRLVGELSAVVEQIEVFNHQFDDFRVVACIRAVNAILYRLQLDDTSLSFLVSVIDDLARLEA